MNDENFTFAISLSVLNHLGRNLYRSFTTVLGEAISNSWDANAENVWIYIDKQKNSFVIKDDGDGMDAKDFQNKFLKIGYSKRRSGNKLSPPPKNRPYIGRKGIGKLALLSCAKRIKVLSKIEGGEYVGGVIDNSGLDDAIKRDLEPDKYNLEKIRLADFRDYTKNYGKGTILYFEDMNEGIKNSLTHIRKMIALYFRFALIDKSFKIFLDDDPVTLDDLDDLAKRTEFLWVINDLKDPYTSKKLRFKKRNRDSDVNLLEPRKFLEIADSGIQGFVASVRTPRQLKITESEERVGIDLYVNGRLRETDILKHIPTARLVESYLYGQIHFNEMDDDKDRFASSREGIVADDDKFKELLEDIRKVLNEILNDWDVWRRKHHKEGDPDNPSIPKKERRAEELYNEVSKEYEIPSSKGQPQKKQKVDQWVDDLSADARYNFTSYAECFISENLVRKHIEDNKISLSKEAKAVVEEMKKKEKESKNRGNISIAIRKAPTKISYLSMDHLANLVDKRDRLKEACLARDASEYKPIRDALMHTALLTDEAQKKLSSVKENVKGRVKTLLSKE